VIHLANLQKRLRVPARKARRLARQIAGKRSLSIAFVTDAAIRRLNREFLRHDFATDVLAFRLAPSKAEGPGADLFGEVVVSADTARAEARRRGIPAQEELLRYVAHGILHLLGYDDHKPRDRARMWARQERELRKAGVSRP
jgi:probable rRNA maturation factor